MDQEFAQALSLHRQGRWHEAAQAYAVVLRNSPRHLDALNLLGQVCCQLGAYPDAIRHLKKCVKLRPGFAPAHAGLGDALGMSGDFKGAVQSLRRAVAIDPALAGAHDSLGHALHEQGLFADAVASCRTALALQPDLATTHNHLGNSLLKLGRLAEAEDSFRRSLELAPEFAAALNNLGIALKEQGRADEGEQCFKRALELNPAYVLAHHNLGGALKARGRLDEAAASFQRALNLDSDDVAAHAALAALRLDQGRVVDAEAYCRTALALVPAYPDVRMTLGGALRVQGRFVEAEKEFSEALRLNPKNLDAYSGLLFCYSNFDHDASARALEVARQCSRMLATHVDRRFTQWRASPNPERLRVGLVSGDFNSHPVGYFLEGVLAHLDAQRIELIAYPTTIVEDALTARLRPLFAQWRSIALISDRAAKDLIYDDAPHVLVDLSGHTALNRLPVFSWKPAPVQASWLGYFGTTGIAEIDYLLADEVGVPERLKAQFTEEIWYLPETRLCFTPPRSPVEVGPLPALANGFVTFGSFQNLAKIGDAVLALWARVLAAVPGAKLRLQAKPFADAAFKQTFLARLQACGIDASRVLVGAEMPREDYLRAHHEVDMILDTFPYPGGTTTCEALWMGVPTLTLAGNTLLARQGASLLTAAGLSEWVAADDAQFVAKALAAAADLPRLAALRAGLREQVLASPLFAAQRFARNLEDALWGMWRARGVSAVMASG